ncbi:hypothetical protein ACFL59_12895 [Planctomycetota bacterium]
MRTELPLTFVVLGLLLFSLSGLGCSGTRVHRVATGPHSSEEHGLPLYASENVPFEYDEIGIVRVVGWSKFAFPEPEPLIKQLAAEAMMLGADAIIGVQLVECGTLFVLGHAMTTAEGLAVAARRRQMPQ